MFIHTIMERCINVKMYSKYTVIPYMFIKIIDIWLCTIYKIICLYTLEQSKCSTVTLYTYVQDISLAQYKTIFSPVPFYWQRLIKIRTWISNYIHGFMWDVIIHQCPNFNGGAVEVRISMSDYIPLFHVDLISHSYPGDTILLHWAFDI